VGTGATAIATAAYHAALEYARTRKQGRLISDKKAVDPVPIIAHADVKWMLLFQRAVCEGSLALIMQCGLYEELIETVPREQKERYKLLLEILTPVAKTFPSEMAILSTSLSIQCFGGYGYCDDFPVEQHFRDTRIHPIHEGTTAVQGMDLLGRKVRMQNGRALTLLLDEVNQSLEEAKSNPSLHPHAMMLADGVNVVTKTTKALARMGSEYGEEAYLANATVYLELFGFFVVGWVWLIQAMIAREHLSKDRLKKADIRFYEGKIKVQEYYFANELPKIYSLSRILTQSVPVTLTVEDDHFTV